MRELMNLKENDVIDDKLAGDSFDILINRRQFGEGSRHR